MRVSTRNARFQQWEALLTNRNKRQRCGAFLIQGVRPISLALHHEWPLEAVLFPADKQLSPWATGVLEATTAERVAMAPELLRELGEKDVDTPELIAVGCLPRDDVERIPVGPGFLGVVFDRPTTPGNIGTLVRSADAFGAHGLVITGHAADPYDPKSVRASTGSLFALPVVRLGSAREVGGWLREQDVDVRIVGTDETGEVDIAAHDLTVPTLLVIGNETSGMSAAWRELCDATVRIPIGGAASSLNAASAGTVALYEAARQRG